MHENTKPALPRFLRTRDAAWRLGLSLRHVQTLVEQGRIPAARIGTGRFAAILIPVAAVEALQGARIEARLAKRELSKLTPGQRQRMRRLEKARTRLAEAEGRAAELRAALSEAEAEAEKERVLINRLESQTRGLVG